MPVLGMNQDFGTVVRWLAQEGEAVAEGQPLLEVETDKAVVEVPAMASGVLAEVSAREGDEVPTGTVIAVLLQDGEYTGEVKRAPQPAAENAPAAAGGTPASGADGPKAAGPSATPGAPQLGRAGAQAGAAPAAPPAVTPPAAQAANGAAGHATYQAPAVTAGAPATATLQVANGRVLASPKARRLAKELSLDLAAVPGTGPGGAVRAVDIVALVSRRPTPRAAAPGASASNSVWLRRHVGVAALSESVARANAYLARQRQPGGVTNADVLAKLTLVALATLGAPQSALGVTRGGPAGEVESCVLGAGSLASLLRLAADRAAGADAGAQAAVHVLDLSEMPYETSMPPLPAGCRLRVTLTSTPGDPGRRGALTLEHEHEPVVEPAQLLTRLAALVEDPASALLYA